MTIRDRVKELRRVRAGDLIPNPKNWRTHSRKQADALKGVLAEIGYADALLARETESGLMLIDGHLRATTTPDTLVPVLVLDVTEAEADKLLATLDPLAAMAGSDADKLDLILKNVDTQNAAVLDLLKKTGRDAGCAWAKQEIVQDEMPEPPKVPVTKPGDLWLLGAYWECEDCHKRFEYAEGVALKEVCPCG